MLNNPHKALDGHESLKRHHLAKKRIREKQIKNIPIKKNAKILDVGVGPGYYLPYWTRETANTGAHFTIFDISPLALNECMENAHKFKYSDRVKAVQGDLFKISKCGLSKYDVIFIGNTFEYIPEPDKYIKSHIIPMLRKGGVLAIRDLDCGILSCNLVDPKLCAKVVYNRILECQKISEKRKTYHNPFIGRDLGRIFQQVGLKNICHKIFPCEFRGPLSSIEKNYLSKLHTSWYLENSNEVLSKEEVRHWFNYFDLSSKKCILNKESFYYVETEFLCTGKYN